MLECRGWISNQYTIVACWTSKRFTDAPYCGAPLHQVVPTARDERHTKEKGYQEKLEFRWDGAGTGAGMLCELCRVLGARSWIACIGRRWLLMHHVSLFLLSTPEVCRTGARRFNVFVLPRFLRCVTFPSLMVACSFITGSTATPLSGC